jgi:hypothetical protein
MVLYLKKELRALVLIITQKKNIILIVMNLLVFGLLKMLVLIITQKKNIFLMVMNLVVIVLLVVMMIMIGVNFLFPMVVVDIKK